MVHYGQSCDMKINILDSWNGKFSSPIRNHWESIGHEVRFNPTWENAKGADVTFFYQSDNAAIEGVQKEGLGKIFVQCVDIEVWAGQASAVDWKKVSGAMFMAKHIQDMVSSQCQLPPKIALIKPGIDLSKWTPKTKWNFQEPVRRIAYVVGDRRIWDVKRLDIAFQLLRDLLDSKPSLVWQLHIRGTYSSHEQYNAYCRYLEKDLKIKDNVVWYENRVDDMNTWLEPMDYLLVPSTKEAFSYATAEAMAKGIKPIINNWESSKETWGPYVCETYGQMLGEFLKGKYDPQEYRNFVLKNYDQNRYFMELDKFIGIGGEENGNN